MRLEIDDNKIMDKVAGCIANDMANNLQRYLQHNYDWNKSNFKTEVLKNQIANLVAQKIYKNLLQDEDFVCKIQGSIDMGISKAVGKYLSKHIQINEDEEFKKLVRLHQKEQIKFLNQKIEEISKM